MTVEDPQPAAARSIDVSQAELRSTTAERSSDLELAGQRMRWQYGLFALITIGVVLLVALIMLSWFYPTASDATTLLSAVTGLLGTVAGLYLGAQAGGAGQQQAQAGQQQALAALLDAQRESNRWAALVDPGSAAQELYDRPDRSDRS